MTKGEWRSILVGADRVRGRVSGEGALRTKVRSADRPVRYSPVSGRQKKSFKNGTHAEQLVRATDPFMAGRFADLGRGDFVRSSLIAPSALLSCSLRLRSPVHCYPRCARWGATFGGELPSERSEHGDFVA